MKDKHIYVAYSLLVWCTEGITVRTYTVDITTSCHSSDLFDEHN